MWCWSWPGVLDFYAFQWYLIVFTKLIQMIKYYYCTISFSSAITRHRPRWFGRNRFQVIGHSPIGRRWNVVRKIGKKWTQYYFKKSLQASYDNKVGIPWSRGLTSTWHLPSEVLPMVDFLPGHPGQGTDPKIAVNQASVSLHLFALWFPLFLGANRSPRWARCRGGRDHQENCIYIIEEKN